jgi:acetyl esterase/lipase
VSVRRRPAAAWATRGALALALLGASPAAAQDSSPLAWAARLENSYRITPNVTYLSGPNWSSHLDLFLVKGSPRPVPTLLFIHGGGWANLSKELRTIAILPYLEMGMNVVNVEYRLLKVAPAPAAVEDCRCALRWVVERAKEYNVDVDHVVMAGESSGGHLALMTGMATAAAGFDGRCQGAAEPAVAAIVNWFGISDMTDLLQGPNLKPYAVAWLADAPERERLATRLSPVTYVRKTGVPPILTIHGDADSTVPYAQSVRFHRALTDAGVPNDLLTIAGGKHAADCCDIPQRTMAYVKIRDFLIQHHVLSAATATTARP